MSIRLNNDMRKEIVDKIIGDRFLVHKKELIERRAKLATRLYNKRYSTKERALMDSLPKGYLPTDDDISATIAGSYIRYNFNGVEYHDYSKKIKPIMQRFPYKHLSGCKIVIDANDPIAKAHAQIERSEQQIEEDERKLRNEVRGVLESCTTVGKLLTVWPEVEPFVKDIAPTPRTNVPAPYVADLNTKLGLQSVKRAA